MCAPPAPAPAAAAPTEPLQIVAFVCDVTDAASVARAAALVASHCAHGLHALINNAGVLRGCVFEVAPHADLTLQLDVNVGGLCAVTRAALPALRRARGRVVNVSSISGVFGAAGTSYYTASKFAVEGLTHA